MPMILSFVEDVIGSRSEGSVMEGRHFVVSRKFEAEGVFIAFPQRAR